MNKIILSLLIFLGLTSSAFADYEEAYYYSKFIEIETTDTTENGEVIRSIIRRPEVFQIVDTYVDELESVAGMAVVKSRNDDTVVLIRAEVSTLEEILNDQDNSSMYLGSTQTEANQRIRSDSTLRQLIPAGNFNKVHIKPNRLKKRSPIDSIVRKWKWELMQWWGMAKAYAASSISDDFTRAGSENLEVSADWEKEGGTSMQVDSTLADAVALDRTFGGLSTYRFTTALDSDDLDGTLDVQDNSYGGPTANGMGLMLRLHATDNTAYNCRTGGSNAGNHFVKVYRNVAGTETELASSVVASYESALFTLQASVADNGSGNPEISITFDSVLEIDAYEDSDASKITGNLYAGICGRNYSPFSDNFADNFQVDVAGGGGPPAGDSVAVGATLIGATIQGTD